MRTLRGWISFLMIVVFSLTLFAQAVAENHAARSCEDDVISTVDCVEDASVALDFKTLSECGDPCHYGVSHFGHGVFALSQLHLRSTVVEIPSTRSAFFDRFCAAPFIEGLRRPPRAA